MPNTPWGELAVNDAHIHFFSRPFYESLAQQKKLDSAEAVAAALHFDVDAGAEALAARWVQELGANGVSRASLMASTPGDEASVSRAVSIYPDRFWGAFMLNPLLPDALQRVQLVARDGHLQCICLFPAMHTYSIADERLVPLLEAASDAQLAVFVHCGAISVGIRKRLGLLSQFDMRYSNPIDLHPVALHFPRIRFIVPHFGAGMLREALMLCDLCPNVYLDTSSSNRWMAYEGLDLRAVFRRAIDVAGIDRLLFGTDSSFFPRGWQSEVFQQQATALYELGLDVEQAVQIFYSNIERVLGPRPLPGTKQIG